MSPRRHRAAVGGTRVAGGNLTVRECGAAKLGEAGRARGVSVRAAVALPGLLKGRVQPSPVTPGAREPRNGCIRDLEGASGCKAREKYPVAGTGQPGGHRSPNGWDTTVLWVQHRGVSATSSLRDRFSSSHLSVKCHYCPSAAFQLALCALQHS